MKIGPILKAARVQRGFTQEQMALDLDVAPSTLYRIESGNRYPSFDLLDKIAAYLRVPVSEIIKAAEGYPLVLNDANNQPIKTLEYTEEILQLVTEVQGFSSRNMRLLIEFTRAINKEFGK
jgi:transcriptional regulator with XRE-family HTH domain